MMGKRFTSSRKNIEQDWQCQCTHAPVWCFTGNNIFHDWFVFDRFDREDFELAFRANNNSWVWRLRVSHCGTCWEWRQVSFSTGRQLRRRIKIPHRLGRILTKHALRGRIQDFLGVFPKTSTEGASLLGGCGGMRPGKFRNRRFQQLWTLFASKFRCSSFKGWYWAKLIILRTKRILTHPCEGLLFTIFLFCVLEKKHEKHSLNRLCRLEQEISQLHNTIKHWKKVGSI